MTELTSPRNPRVRRLAALHRRRSRDAQGRHLADGPHAVMAALDAGIVDELFVGPDAAEAFRDRGDVVVTRVSDAVVTHLADAVHPQGVVALVRTPVADWATVCRGRTVLLGDALHDPGNVGTIVRTAHALGVEAIALSTGSVDPFAPKVVRATAGGVYQIPIAVGIDIDAALDRCVAGGFVTVGLDANGTLPVAALGDIAPRVALVAGGEAQGLRPAVRDRLDHLASIAMPGGAESLNVAVAVAIALYERCGRPVGAPATDGTASTGD